MIRLRSDWRRVVRYTWSIRFTVLAGVLGSVEVILPQFVDTFPRNAFAALSVVAAVAGAISRVIDQPGMEIKAGRRHDD